MYVIFRYLRQMAHVWETRIFDASITTYWRQHFFKPITKHRSFCTCRAKYDSRQTMFPKWRNQWLVKQPNVICIFHHMQTIPSNQNKYFLILPWNTELISLDAKWRMRVRAYYRALRMDCERHIEDTCLWFITYKQLSN